MNDLTILYYTANIIPDITGQRIRDHLLKVTKNQFPIISVSQKPLVFGQNICVGEIGKSKYNCYKQIFIGVREVKTKYVACAEDDTLYSKDHFMYRPDEVVFSYDRNYWLADRDFYWRIEHISKRGGMWGCISATQTLLDNLTARYALYPTDPLFPASAYNKHLQWGEPGLADHIFGLKSKVEYVDSENPSVIFHHFEAMGSKQLRGWQRRYGEHKPENIAYNIEPFGGIKKLWETYWP